MDRYVRQISTNKILQVQSGGDNNRKPKMSDADWDALKASRLDTLKQYGIKMGVPEADLQVGWMDPITIKAEHDAQIETQRILDMTWVDKRKQDMADGGYGTNTEQFEFLGEQGIGAYQSHINTVKSRHPKP
jgi:hypothetical protein